ncbi:hypothetical protein OIDMADRAFT_55714 [Oidiodendron maius Zn]|uniref:Uncharacterized protein n=1 Tax=Oidiodendron maius (strain Zn) TaxID=913774 RepID=A0A0C3HBR7_OIDMZ|nr:hypothetical protein OIDMADRAFT_55714 [Oidiodendron maius Zn]
MVANSSLEGSGEDLKSLYNVEAAFKYTSRNGLARALRTFQENSDVTLDHVVLVTGFPPKLFNIEDDNNSLPVKGKSLYFQDLQILILTMKGPIHEFLSLKIHDLFRDKITRMGCWDDLKAIGGATQSLGNVGKEPDQSWGPISTRYTTLVLEVGVSESLRAVDADAQRWIKNGRSVTQVVTVKVYPHKREIIFAIWQGEPGRQAKKDKEIHIEMNGGQLSVRKARQLGLSFKEIFERQPKPGTNEGDVNFSARELGIIAQQVWRQMALYDMISDE